MLAQSSPHVASTVSYSPKPGDARPDAGVATDFTPSGVSCKVPLPRAWVQRGTDGCGRLHKLPQSPNLTPQARDSWMQCMQRRGASLGRTSSSRVTSCASACGPGRFSPGVCCRLDACQLTSACCVDLASVLTGSRCLKELNLAGNPLDRCGVLLLCAALRRPECGLQTLG